MRQVDQRCRNDDVTSTVLLVAREEHRDDGGDGEESKEEEQVTHLHCYELVMEPLPPTSNLMFFHRHLSSIVYMQE